MLGTGWTLAVCASVGIPDWCLKEGEGAFGTVGLLWRSREGNLLQRAVCEGRERSIWDSGPSVNEERGEFLTEGRLWKRREGNLRQWDIGERGNLGQWAIREGGEGGIWDSGPYVKEERGNLRQRAICEGGERGNLGQWAIYGGAVVCCQYIVLFIYFLILLQNISYTV